MATKNQPEPIDLLAEIERTSDDATRAARVGDLVVHIKSSWTGEEVLNFSPALLGTPEDLIRGLIPDQDEADALWEKLKPIPVKVATRILNQITFTAGLATEEGFLERSTSSDTPEGGDEQ